MTLFGLFFEVLGFYGLIVFSPALIGLAIQFKMLIMIMITVVLLIGYSVSLRGLFSIHDISNLDLAMEKRMNKIKHRMNYPIWQATAIWGMVITSVIIMVSGSVLAG